MSKIEVNTIEPQSGTDVTIGASGDTLKVDTIASRTAGGRVVLPDVNNYPPYRNIVINGDMSVAQRGTTASGLSNGNSGYHTVDRFSFSEGGSPTGAFTMSQSTDVPTGQGFAKSLKMDCTTADASLGGTDTFGITTKFEGQMLQYLKKGTSNAESWTLSFWVKSNKTGTYTTWVYDQDNARQISKTYTIDSASTWEKKTITFAGDTTGTFDNDNAMSMYIEFNLGTGTTYSSGTLQTTWGGYVAGNRYSSSQVNIADSTANEWYITGVQLEVGDSATPFEFLPHDVNLQRCQRYYLPLFEDSGGRYIANAFYYASTHIKIHVEAPVDMRATPSIDQTVASNCWIMYSNGSGQTFSNTIVMDGGLKTRFFSMYASAGDVSGTAGHAGGFYGQSGAGGFLALNAEL